MEPQPKKQQPEKRVMILCNWRSWGIMSPIKELCNLLLNKLAYDPSKIGSILRLSRGIELVVAPGYLHIPLVRALLADYIEVAAQDVSAFANGEYTGEISAKLLKEHKVKWVMIGHSERREKFGDKDEVDILAFDRVDCGKEAGAGHGPGHERCCLHRREARRKGREQDRRSYPQTANCHQGYLSPSRNAL